MQEVEKLSELTDEEYEKVVEMAMEICHYKEGRYCDCCDACTAFYKAHKKFDEERKKDEA